MGRAKHLTVQQIEDYLKCPLFYRYRHELQVPHYKWDKDKFLVKSVRNAVSSWFNSLGRGYSRKEARQRVGNHLHSLWSQGGGLENDFPLAHAQIMSILIDLSEFFKEGTDAPIGGGLETSMVANGWLITDHIDGIFIQNEQKCNIKRKEKKLVLIQVDHDNAGTIGPRVAHMRMALARYTFNVAMKHNTLPIALLRLTVPSLRRKSYNLEKKSYKEFMWLANNVTRHINSDSYLPSDNDSTCSKCWYAEGCSNYFCEPNLQQSMINKLTELISAKEGVYKGEGLTRNK